MCFTCIQIVANDGSVLQKCSQSLLQFEVNFNKVAFQKFYQISYAVHRLPLLPTHEFEGQKFCKALR